MIISPTPTLPTVTDAHTSVPPVTCTEPVEFRPVPTMRLSPLMQEKLPASIKGIWVYPKGEGLELEPVPPSLWASTKELEAQLEDPDPGVRNDTFETLIERQGAHDSISSQTDSPTSVPQ